MTVWIYTRATGHAKAQLIETDSQTYSTPLYIVMVIEGRFKGEKLAVTNIREAKQ